VQSEHCASFTKDDTRMERTLSTIEAAAGRRLPYVSIRGGRW
jgi:hypothetical protein